MAFRTQDLCKTTRRVTGSTRRRLFPRLLRDDRLLPRIGLAIRVFETKLGLRRADLEPEALVHLFDDPRLARCLVGCLGRSYRYRTRPLADLIGAARVATLGARGLATPFDLRALAFARANERRGYVPPGEHAAFLAALAPELDLAEVEAALWLDAPDQAILTRVGPVPTTAEVRALYNLRVVETVLRAAEVVQLAIRGEAATVLAVCERHGVPATVTAGSATLRGEPNAVAGPARQGTRLARAALTLLAGGLLGPGEATVRLGDETYELRLDGPLLKVALPPHAWSAPAATWAATEALVEGLQAARRQGHLAGWRLRRWPEPLVSEAAVLWPELALSRGDQTIRLLPLTSAGLGDGADALAVLAGRRGVVALVDGPVGSRDVPSDLTVLPLTGAAAPAALVQHLVGVASPMTDEVAPAWLTALAAAAYAAGSIGEAELARRLDCPEEQVAGRLAAVPAAADVVYVDGFGLCAADFLVRARALLTEESGRDAGRLDLATLGRRLRLLVGRNEGLHALIAHLGGHLRPVA